MLQVGARVSSSSSRAVAEAKTRLRRRIMAQRSGLPRAEIQRKSLAIAAHVRAVVTFCAGQTVMVYLALPYEVQTGPLISEARRRATRIVVPVVRGAELVVVEFPDDCSRLRRGAYGILEPLGTAPTVQPEEIHCILVPGIAFDRQGGRLGYGKGYYDRFLPQVPTTTRWYGLAFALQVVPCVPQMPHDIRMHGVITERGMIPCRMRSAGHLRCKAGHGAEYKESASEFE
jgi:5-formyltetrahydrofolate cyclo-ligase